MKEKISIESICCIAQQAGALIMKHYQGDIDFSRKEDNSPVTVADMQANDYIVAQLQQLAPHIPIISEEQEAHVLPDGATRFWLVDPLDGTKSFIRREDEFTVNIALIEDGAPVLGVIDVPAKGERYAGVVGEGATRNGEVIHTRAVPKEGMEAVMSLSHLDPQTEAFLANYKVAARVQAASSLKFCKVAQGRADIYPRFGPTMQWDTAAGHAIVVAAGGRVEQPDGSAFSYGARDFRNGPFVAYGV